MTKWSIFSVVVALIMLIPLASPGVSAQDLTAQNSNSLVREAPLVSGDSNNSAHYVLSDNGTMTRAEIMNEQGVPGKGIDNAPGLRKFFNSFSQAMERLRNRFRVRLNERHMPKPGYGTSDNTTVTDNTTMTKGEILKERGVPGKGIDEAPGLQEPFNPNSNAADNAGNKNREKVKEKNKVKSGNSDNVTMNKADILNESGVPGRGIDEAPGLQKQFNDKSNASDNAGKKKNK